MRRNAVIVVAAVAVLVALFVLLRPGDSAPPASSSAPDVTETPLSPEPTPEDESPHPDETRPSPSNGEGGEQHVTVRVADGTVSGPTQVSVDVDETVHLTVESDAPDEVHVHGYDISADVEPGSPAEIEFVASAAGVFEVELEGESLLLLRLRVTA